MDRLQHLLRNVDGIFPALGLPDRSGIAVMEDGTPRTNYFRCDFWLMHISSVLPMSEFPAGITFMNYDQIHGQFPICTTPLLHRRCGFLLHVCFGLVPRLQDWFAAWIGAWGAPETRAFRGNPLTLASRRCQESKQRLRHPNQASNHYELTCTAGSVY